MAKQYFYHKIAIKKSNIVKTHHDCSPLHDRRRDHILNSDIAIKLHPKVFEITVVIITTHVFMCYHVLQESSRTNFEFKKNKDKGLIEP